MWARSALMPLGWRSARPLPLPPVVPDWHVFLWGPLSPVSPSNLLIEREEPLTRGTHLPDPVNALCASEAAPSSYPKLDRVPPSLALGFAQGIDRRGEAVGIDLGHVACAAGWNATHSSGLLVNTR